MKTTSISSIRSVGLDKRKTAVSHKYRFRLIKIALTVIAGVLFVTGSLAQVFPPACTPPTGNVGDAIPICSGFSPSVATGLLTPDENSRYRITAAQVSGIVTGFTPLQTGITVNSDVEPNNLFSTSTGIVEYTVIPYGFGVNNIDNGGLGDDCQGPPLVLSVTVSACPPLCIGTKAFSDYVNSTPASGTAGANFTNNDGTNTVAVTNTITGGSFNAGRPGWIVGAGGIQINRGGTVGTTTTTTYVFGSQSRDYSFTIASLQSTGLPGVLTYLETVTITAMDAANNIITPQFYNLNDGAQVINGNELRDNDGGNQASASVYFNEPVKQVVITQTGTQDDITVILAGCAFPSDYGDLAVGVWPVASAVVPGIVGPGNVPDPYDPVTRPKAIAWAGSKVSTELFVPGNGSVAANTDLEDDGLIPPLIMLNPGFTYNFQVVLNANRSGTKVYYRLWFDWNKNGNFADDVDGGGVNRATYAGSGIATSPITVNVPVKPPYGAAIDYKARLAVSLDTVTDVYRNSQFFILNLNNGEIEDYQAPAILPVTLLRFTAQKQGNSGALLNWQVATETRLDRYEIEYGQDGITFNKIGFLPATGSSSYMFTHNLIAGNRSSGYYRLKVIDKDGKYNYSPVRSLNWNGSVNITMTPNPVKDRMLLRVDSYNEGQKLSAIITDAAGRTVAKRIITNAVSEIDASRWANGIYNVQIMENTQVIYKQKMVKN